MRKFIILTACAFSLATLPAFAQEDTNEEDYGYSVYEEAPEGYSENDDMNTESFPDSYESEDTESDNNNKDED
jgi:hypothetical protein